MDQFEKFENQLLSSYKSTLSAKGKEIFQEIDFLLQDDEEFNFDKAENYCHFCLTFRKDFLDNDLLNKCQKFKYDSSNFRSIKYNLNSISEVRKNQKKSLKKMLINT